MDIVNAAFVKSATSTAQLPEEQLPEFAFVGRSNVGKSSLINSLCRRRGLARVSATPGKTALINYFRADIKTDGQRKAVHLVDLPGYGYAKTSKANRTQWSGFINSYVEQSKLLCAVFLLVDSRLDAQPLDLEARRWLQKAGREVVLVLTKTDKLTRNQLACNRKKLLQAFECARAVPYSSVTALGREELIDYICERAEDNEELC